MRDAGRYRGLVSIVPAVFVAGCYVGFDDSVSGLGADGTGATDTAVATADSSTNPRPTSGSTPDSGASMSGTPADTEPLSTGPTTSPLSAGTGSTAADDPSSGDTSDTEGDGGLDPLIPDAGGPCPSFSTGTSFIRGLNTIVVAGTPGATKGPLLLYWHGTGGNPETEMPAMLTAMQRDEIVAEGGLILAPVSNGANRGGYSPNGVWYEGTDGEGGDLEWADQVVACAVQTHNIDPRRIYTTGCSAGGLMASGLAVKRSEYVASATPNSGGLTAGGAQAVQDPSRLPAVMTMHGGATDTVVINFGQSSATLADLVTDAGGFALGCNHASGHCQAPANLRAAAWEFHKDHPFGELPSPYVGGLPGGFPGYCTIW